MRIAIVVALMGLSACSGQEVRQQGEAPYDVKLAMKPLMAEVMQRAAENVWSQQGYVIDATGTHSLFPKNDEEWAKAEESSLLLAELTNVLLLPGRRVPEPAWDNSVAEVRKAAQHTADVARTKDEDAFMLAGSAINDACEGCHETYRPDPAPRPTPNPAPVAPPSR